MPRHGKHKTTGEFLLNVRHGKWCVHDWEVDCCRLLTLVSIVILVSVLNIVIIVKEMFDPEMGLPGCISITALFMSPWFFAAFLAFQSPNPNIGKLLLWSLALFLIYMAWWRGYIVKCQEAWSDLCVAKPLVTLLNVSSPCHTASQTPKPGSIELVEYAREKWRINCDSRPAFWFLTGNKDTKSQCSWQSPNGLLTCVARPRCFPWTCYFAEGGSKYFHYKAWTMWSFFLSAVTATLVWVTNILPRCDARCCCWCFSPTTTRKVSWFRDKFLQCGQMPVWLRWFWAAYIPFWLCWYATVTSGGFKNFFPKMHFDISAISALLSDAKNVAMVAMAAVVVVCIWINRSQIYVMMGIDDRQILHWSNWFAFQTEDEQRVLQVCVWRVKEKYDGCFSRIDDLEDMQKGREETQGHDFQSAIEALRTASESRKEASKMSWFPCSRGKPWTGGTMEEQQPILDLKTDCSIFVRVAYGHNEPLHGRVVRLTPDFDSHDVEEVFRVNKDDSTLESEMAPLYVELMKQDLVGRQDLGRITITAPRLRYWLERNGRILQNLPATVTGTQLDKNKKLDKLQLQRMYKISSEEAQELNEEQIMTDVGFKEMPLSKGGSVWLAIAEVDSK